ncbi:MAG TPA: glutamine amidotransferase, partial [Planctomycetota bacterium]|nr:glutamine amidotransferase [Planctomycetota bacterium]
HRGDMFETLFKYPLELYRQGEVGFSARLPVEVKVLLAVLAGTAVWWLYRKPSQNISVMRRRVLFTLRALSVALLIVMVLGPVLRLPKLKNVESFLAVMLDNSRSMTIEDSAGGGTRFDSASKLLIDPKSGLSAQLPETALRVFTFADGAKRTSDTRTITAEGERTNIYRSIREVDQELRGVSVSAIVMATDGGSNTGGTPLDMARHLKSQNIRLYTIGFGSPNPPKDYEIVRIAVPRQVRRNAQVEAFTTVRCTGFKDPFTVFLRQGEAILSTMEVRPQPGKDMYQVRFAFYPEQTGAQKYNLFIKPSPEEKVTDNNLREFIVDVTESRLPVLYVEGSPRPEFRFLRRALFRDADFRLVPVVRFQNKTPREPAKFYAQNVEDMPELKDGFPKTKEQLYKFEALILGDIEASVFTQDQLKMIEEFVKERGGGFAMLGGVNSFNLGGYIGTPLEALLPITMEDNPNAYSFERFRMQVPESALRHPILHQSDDADQNKYIWEKVPELQGYNITRGVKSAAQLLATHPRTNHTILAVQNYGRGRAAAFCTGGSWAWRMSVPTDDEIQEKFWRQLVRWLAVGSKENVSVTLDRDIYAKGEPVIIRATVLGQSLEAVNDAVVKCKVQDPFGNTEEFDMPWILTQDGVYQCRYETREHGDHKVMVNVQIPNLKPIDVQTSFPVTQPFLEFNNAGLNENLLRQMAEITGGKYFNEKDAAGLVSELKALTVNQERAGTYVEEKDLWDMPVFFILLVALLGCEWSARRRAGLA